MLATEEAEGVAEGVALMTGSFNGNCGNNLTSFAGRSASRLFLRELGSVARERRIDFCAV